MKIVAGNAVGIQSDGDAELRSAVCIYLIGEQPEGATIGELTRLALGGGDPAEEVDRVSRAVSRLVQEGEMAMEGDRVVASSLSQPISDPLSLHKVPGESDRW